ncbi:HIT family protein [Clostridium kluyveri]|uniref:HIT domain-containing protein n=2 Tax=Clostridium kluyveri TaxID=1534 RepID=A5MZB7_CLOK5|nr:HIT family protein [Clostridium kluyveri]EDK34213.1 Conserved hypothetical protein [Clostridium kluyveri DSM 555]BAH06987.1 hypothetical protein CKR_1936 [Clostridium kluyveri NBRC 12016]
MFGCSFCSEINNDDYNNLIDKITYPAIGLNDRIVYETKNWVVMPTLGGFIKGYLLIVTKQHFISISTCPEELFSELEYLVKAVKRVFINVYNSPAIMFEHGAISQFKRGGCCVDHVHLHILPYNGDIIGEIIKDDTKHELVKSFYDVKNVVIKHNNPYIFYEDNFGRRYVLFNKYFPSQYIRKIVCNKLGISEHWDWRSKFFLENMVDTIKDVRNLKWGV